METNFAMVEFLVRQNFCFTNNYINMYVPKSLGGKDLLFKENILVPNALKKLFKNWVLQWQHYPAS